MFSGSSLAAIPQLAVVLGIMVLVHEFGHFAAAKLCGVRVEAFAIGFGKRLFGFYHGGTDYRLNLLPLGGYVKMAGEMDPSGIQDSTGAPNAAAEPVSNDPGELQNHPRWQRTIIALAGPVANFILAFVLMTVFYMAHNEVMDFVAHPGVVDYVSPNSQAARTGIQPGDTVVSFDNKENPNWDDVEDRAQLNLNQETPFSYLHDGHRVDTHIFVENKGRAEDFTFEKLGLVPVMQKVPVAVMSVADRPNMPAARAGLQSGDRILSIDGRNLHSVTALLAYLQDQAGKPAQLVIERPVPSGSGGSTRTFPVTLSPELGDAQDGTKMYQIGFHPVPPPTVVEHYPLGKAAAASWEFNKKNSLLIRDVLQRLFTRQVSVKSLSSPIGIGVQVHEAFEMPGWLPIIGTMAMISLNLGIFNLLPIPILDGGMIAFLAIESLIRRDLNAQIKERVYQVAFVCIVLFAAIVIFNDITKYLPTHLKT